MLTNGHVWYDYGDGDHVPTLPLKGGRADFHLNNPYTVTDADGYVMAAFRNKSDYDRYMTGTKERHDRADRTRRKA